MLRTTPGKTELPSRDILALYDTYYKVVYNRVYFLVGNRMDAEDITQDAFLGARDKAHQLKDAERFKAWIMTIARNKALNHLRRKTAELDLEELEEDIEDQEAGDPWEGFETGTILQALAELPDGYRSVLSLYLLEDMSHEMIAAELGISSSASRSQYCRGKKILQEKLLTHHGQA